MQIITYLVFVKFTVCFVLFKYNLIPKAELSLKVLAELPIIVVLMYQLYKQQVYSDVADFIPLIMSTINMQPTPQQRLADVEIAFVANLKISFPFVLHNCLEMWKNSKSD